MNRVAIGAAVLGVLIAAGGAYWWHRSASQSPTAGPIARAPATASAVAERLPPPVEHPVESAPPAVPLPPLERSDDFVRQRLAAVTAAPALLELLPTERLARRVVATVDGLTRDGVPLETRALVAAPGRLVVDGGDDAWVLAAANAERYEPYLQTLEALPVERAASLYREMYPLLQSAYEELGYPDRYFNDRMVAVIDHLLDTPAVDEPIRLARPHVLYTYADPALERRSAGQKAMIRLGGDGARRVKAWLREFRAAIAS